MNPPRETASQRLAWLLFATSIVLSMALSSYGLLLVGIPYDAPYGPIVAKIHPGSYLLVLAWLVALAARGNPLAVLSRQIRTGPLVATFFGCMIAVFAWVIYRHGTSGAAYIIQTLWMPSVALFVLQLLGPSRHRQTVNLIMAMLALNAVIALIEYSIKQRLVAIPAPIEQPGVAFFRSSALLGHPLLNANVTIALLPAVTMLPLRATGKVAMALLLIASVLAFGARTALIMGVATYGACLLAVGSNHLVRGRYSYLQLTGGSVALVACVVALAIVSATTGLGDRIFQNLTWDSSASVRTRVWSAFDYLSDAGWWFGVSPFEIDRISLKMGLDPQFEAIENFWIYAFLQYGVVGYVPFIVGIGCLTVHLLKVTTPAMRIGILLFYVVASTSNSLSSKTISVTMLAIVAVAGGTSRRRAAAQPLRAGGAMTPLWAHTGHSGYSGYGVRP